MLATTRATCLRSATLVPADACQRRRHAPARSRARRGPRATARSPSSRAAAAAAAHGWSRARLSRPAAAARVHRTRSRCSARSRRVASWRAAARHREGARPRGALVAPARKHERDDHPARRRDAPRRLAPPVGARSRRRLDDVSKLLHRRARLGQRRGAVATRHRPHARAVRSRALALARLSSSRDARRRARARAQAPRARGATKRRPRAGRDARRPVRSARLIATPRQRHIDAATRRRAARTARAVAAADSAAVSAACGDTAAAREGCRGDSHARRASFVGVRGVASTVAGHAAAATAGARAGELKAAAMAAMRSGAGLVGAAMAALPAGRRLPRSRWPHGGVAAAAVAALRSGASGNGGCRDPGGLTSGAAAAAMARSRRTATSATPPCGVSSRAGTGAPGPLVRAEQRTVRVQRGARCDARSRRSSCARRSLSTSVCDRVSSGCRAFEQDSTMAHCCFPARREARRAPSLPPAVLRRRGGARCGDGRAVRGQRV